MRESIRKGDPERQRHWQEVMRQWQESGQSVREYCRVQGLQESAFYFWRRTLARRGQGLSDEEVPPLKARPTQAAPRSPKRVPLARRKGPAFLPIQVVEAARPATGRGVEIVLPQGRAVRVEAGFDRQTLSDVLAVLESRPC